MKQTYNRVTMNISVKPEVANFIVTQAQADRRTVSAYINMVFEDIINAVNPEDFNEEEDSYEILTDPDDFTAVYEALENEKIPMAEAEVTMIPQTWVELTDEQDIKMMNKILDLLDDDDDVQNVYHNWDE